MWIVGIKKPQLYAVAFCFIEAGYIIPDYLRLDILRFG